jgi:hypothetical protein
MVFIESAAAVANYTDFVDFAATPGEIKGAQKMWVLRADREVRGNRIHAVRLVP